MSLSISAKELFTQATQTGKTSDPLSLRLNHRVESEGGGYFEIRKYNFMYIINILDDNASCFPFVIP